MSAVYNLNVSTPFLLGVPNSRISPEWIRFLAALTGAANANGGATPDDVATIVLTNRKPVDQSNALMDIQAMQIITALRGVVQDLKRRVEELELQVQKKNVQVPALLSQDAVDNLQVVTSKRPPATTALVDDNTTNQTVYPVWGNGSGGQYQMKTSTAQWSFNPSTGNMTLTGALAALSGTAIPAGGAAGAGLLVSSTANFGIFFGSGAPALSAAKGSLYLRSDGTTTNNRAYINTNGSTTWTALTTVA